MAKSAGTNNDLLAMALVGYEAQIAKINAAMAEIRAKLGHGGGGPAQAPPKHTMSVAGRRRIAAAQRKRWAAVKQQAKSAAKAAVPRKRKLSAAGRKAIIAATKKRWAAVRKAAGKRAKAGARAQAQKAATATA